jgi:hypothetical protein
MGDITLFELHFDGGLQLGPSFGDDPSPDVEATDGGETMPEDAETDDADDADGDEPAVDVDPEDESGTPVKGAIVGVLALLALAIAARVLLGDDEDVDDVEMVELEDTPHESD